MLFLYKSEMILNACLFVLEIPRGKKISFSTQVFFYYRKCIYLIIFGSIAFLILILFFIKVGYHYLFIYSFIPASLPQISIL